MRVVGIIVINRRKSHKILWSSMLSNEYRDFQNTFYEKILSVHTLHSCEIKEDHFASKFDNLHTLANLINLKNSYVKRSAPRVFLGR